MKFQFDDGTCELIHLTSEEKRLLGQRVLEYIGVQIQLLYPDAQNPICSGCAENVLRYAEDALMHASKLSDEERRRYQRLRSNESDDERAVRGLLLALFGSTGPGSTIPLVRVL